MIGDIETEAEVVADEPVVESAAVEVDLSRVPEKVREHVDADKYATDEDYKRAIEHGWKPKDVYVGDGGDEANWAGYRVFNKRYDDMQERKEYQKTQAELKRSVDAVISTFEQDKQAAVKQAIVETEQRLKLAIEDGDAKEAVRLQSELMEKKQAMPQPARIEAEPIAVEILRKRNPALNPASADFNKELNAEFERICIDEAQSQFKRRGQPLNDAQIQIIVEDAFNMIKDKMQKPAAKVQAKAPATSKPANTVRETDPVKGLNATQKQMYNKMLAMNNGKQIAENYLKQLQSK
jgi:hypothetical protein